MTTRFKIAGIIVATLLIGIILGAVGRGAFTRVHREKLDAMKRAELLLSRVNEAVEPDSSQKPKVEEIIKRTAERIDTLFNHNQAEMADLMNSMKRDLSAVLTPDQQKRLNQELKFSERPGKERRNLGASMAFSYEYAEHLQQDLDLDSAQTDRLLQIIRESHDRMAQQLDKEKAGSQETNKLREAFMNETNAKIEAILTPKQKEQFHELLKERERFVEHELKEEEQ